MATSTSIKPSLTNMRVPVLKSQCPRRIIAEDPTYNIPIIPELKYLILNSIAAKYSGQWKLSSFSLEERHYLMKKIPLDLPLLKAIPIIEDEVYWRRRCVYCWSVCDVGKYSNSWKVMCLQRSLEEMIENFQPLEDDSGLEEILKLTVAVKNYVQKLDIGQLLPKQSHHDENMDFEEGHVNFERIFEELDGLKEFHVTYSLKNCEDAFEWNAFQMSRMDCQLLVSSLVKSSTNLTVFDLHNSDLDDAGVNLMIHAWQKLPKLEVLLLPHNKIGNKGAFSIAKLLLAHDKIRTVNLMHNLIGEMGGQALAYALAKNSTLRSLDLRLNCIADDGGSAICKALVVNKGLQELNLASNNIGEGTAEVLSHTLAANKTLQSLDLACNDAIGEIGGVYILEGLEKNGFLTFLDLRLCNVAQDTEYFINKLLKQHQGKKF